MLMLIFPQRTGLVTLDFSQQIHKHTFVTCTRNKTRCALCSLAPFPSAACEPTHTQRQPASECAKAPRHNEQPKE